MEEGYSRKEKLKIRIWDTKEEREHFHQDIELLYVLEGTLRVTMGEQKTELGAEDILVINANKKHGLRGTDDILFAKLSISYELVSDIFQSVNIIFWCDSTKDDHAGYDELRNAMKKLLNHYLNENGATTSFGHISLCYRIMDILSVNFLVRAADREGMSEKDRYENRILQINNYIRANYSQPISLKELSEKLFLSNGYLSRFFKKNYGMSFAEYLSNIRLYHAVDELLYTNAKITRIAYDNGFASAAVFNRDFKEVYGETPTAFRKKAKDKGEREENEFIDTKIQTRLERYLIEKNDTEEETGPVGVEEDEYSVRESEELTPFWSELLNAGAAEDLTRAEIQEHIARFSARAGIRYVRFWNVFSKNMLIDIHAEEYNFSRLDIVIDFLLGHGLKPHIELGRKPRLVLRNVQSFLVEETTDELFETIEQSDRLMDAMFHHLVRRYGRSEFDSWRLEFWYDERYLSSGTAIRDYFEGFEHMYRAARRYSQKIEIGGYGIRVGYDRDLASDFFTEWGKRAIKPDFLSAYNYSYTRGEIDSERYSKRSADPSYLLHSLQLIRRLMNESGLEKIKLYVTEWNLTISDRNFINDTCFKGAYIVKNAIESYGMADTLGYFLCDDQVSEYSDTNAPLRGGTGLIARDGILKPAGFAYTFLNQLYPYLIGRGEHYILTTDCRLSYAILCHNQKELSYSYYFTKEDEIEKEHLWKYFNDLDNLDLSLTLSDTLGGMYQARVYRVNKSSGSLLDMWEDLDYEKDLSRETTRYLSRTCEPKLSMLKMEAKDSKLEVKLRLEANEIALVLISPVL